MLTIKNIKQFSELAAKLEKIYNQQEAFGALFGLKINMEIEENVNQMGGNSFLSVDFMVFDKDVMDGDREYYYPASETATSFIKCIKAGIHDAVINVMTES